ncbi:uncharacterized protein LOC127834040 [Dreissena polymorpha]|uniref:C1q domain-containing protein n=1 Tax=Dreissena polymorpha TaxID=45954 RepID=A0A9D4FTZ9_DREPO|nr:uncharacterized protein LOC127834040 [Dreissena polymorpha]KAH3805344.1 hypothetical protein DPMN_133645 [Dreissena polymorpha]
MQLQKKSLCLLLNVIVAMCAREPSSPICSKYDYEERLLERVIKNEFALETTLKDILKTNANVVDALKQLEDGKMQVESSLAVMEKRQMEMETRLADFITNSSNVMNSTLAAMFETSSQIKQNASVTAQQLVNEVRVLKDSLKVPTIYFRARITASSTDLSSGQDVVFPIVEVNEGQGYDPSTGKFTASISGMYLFTVQYCVYGKKHVEIEIVHGGRTLQRSTNYDFAGNYPCLTMQISAALAFGDLVWARSHGSSTFYASSNRYTIFAGTLIHV